MFESFFEQGVFVLRLTSKTLEAEWSVASSHSTLFKTDCFSFTIFSHCKIVKKEFPKVNSVLRSIVSGWVSNFGVRDTKVVLDFSKLSKGAESFSRKAELIGG